MIFTIISLIFLVILVLIAIRIGMKKEEPEEQAPSSLIHASGIYSIVRKSPREEISTCKPADEEIRKYLSSQNENLTELRLSSGDRDSLLAHWVKSLNDNIQEIEKGDNDGVEFYYYEFPQECPICSKYMTKGRFVTREEIFQYPAVIPPFHLGCTCRINAHHGKENLRETTEKEMRPLFRDGVMPPLPAWTQISKLS